MTRARLCAKAFWLTYSQSSLTKRIVFEKLQALGTIARVIVAHEHHEDGGSHFHALVEYRSTKDVSTSHFDIQGEHPNIAMWTRAGGSTYDVWMLNHWQYCRKEDEDPLTAGEPPSESRKRSRDEMVSECIEVARKKGAREAMKMAMIAFPADYCKGVNGYDKVFVREANEKPSNPARSIAEFPNAPKVPDNWRSLFIWGPTGHGKTQFARALLPNAVVVRHRDQLKEAHFPDGLIFDDFAVSHWPPTAIIALVDWEESSGLDVKHGHVMIPCGTRKIFCFNKNLRQWCGAPPKDPPEPSRGPYYGRDDVPKFFSKKHEEMDEEQYRAVRRRFTAVYQTTCPLFGGATLTTDPPGAVSANIQDGYVSC